MLEGGSPPPHRAETRPEGGGAGRRSPAAAPGEAAAEAVALYDPKGKRDPFLPFLKVETKAAYVPLGKVPPLQRYDLGELKLVGVMWGGRGYRALVEDGEGKGHTVTVGTRIGRDGGVVSRITQDEVIVKEFSGDSGGAKYERKNSLKLQTAGGQ